MEIFSDEVVEKNTIIKHVYVLFNKIATQGKGPDGKWTRKPLAYQESNILSSACNLPS